MHDTARSNGKLFFDTYVSRLRNVTVVDVGSQDVGGSLREVCPADARYIGVDVEKAKGVDIVVTDPYSLPFEDGTVDVVVSSSCFEHSEMFWLVIGEIFRVLRPGGLFYLNAPSNGVVHRYPVDCWRFYPDSGRALVSWVRRCGWSATLLESYISHQQQQMFNDFVAVFLKDESRLEEHPCRILSSHAAFDNGFIHGKDELINATAIPEDWRLSDHLPRAVQLLLHLESQMAQGIANDVTAALQGLFKTPSADARWQGEDASRELDRLGNRLSAWAREFCTWEAELRKWYRAGRPVSGG